MNEKKAKPLAGRRLVDAIVSVAQDKLAEQIVVIDLREMATTADFFIIGESASTVHNRAIAQAIIDHCEEKGTIAWHNEGLNEGRWILIDYADVVVHILLSDLRAFYLIETLWPPAKRTDVPPLHRYKED